MIGKTISHYKIIEKLGEGGMGVVYKAEDTKLERTVALKFLSPHSIGTEEEKVRFVREAKAAAALTHPNICTVHEINDLEDQPFIAMEYIEGDSLSDKIGSAPLEINDVINIALRVAEGLRHAHMRGIVHRDIKPANIMVTEDGQAKIMDFGLARLSNRTRLTGTGTIMGTVAYMSPEQAHGRTAIDYRTDIWSLGVVLYEMIAGRLPFDAPTDAGLIYKVIHETPEPLRHLRDDVPASLERIIDRAMQKDSHDRYEGMEALIADLEAARPGKTLLMGKRSPSIVVLPFVNMSADPDQEYFCDGLAEELINALTQIGDLKVIARTSAFSFKGKDVKVADIGRELKVDTVLEGSVRKAGNRLRITAQLVETRDSHHLWSERYDREMHDIFAIQDEITQAIVDNLKPQLLGKEEERIAKRQTADLDAYSLYLRGRWFWNKRAEEELKKAIACFEQAIEKDPDYSPAYAGLADTYIVIPVHSPFPAKEAYVKAREAATKAVEIDNSLAEAHASLGFIKTQFEWDWDGAEKEFGTAIELNPGYATAHHWYAVYLSGICRFEEAVSEIERALELDPLSLIINTHAGIVFLRAARLYAAREILERVVEMDPNFVSAHLYLGEVYLQLSLYDEALAEFEEEKRVTGSWNPFPEAMMGVVYAHMGEKNRAREVLEGVLCRTEEINRRPTAPAILYFALGEHDQGFEWLEKAYERRSITLCWIKSEPSYDPVRQDARFHALLRKMNLDT